ncbi:uncharacterized protein BO96DRAFT_406126 [Aspergillus niger CBS 101883]|uniref:Uncharacterized protein n=3 Tax=Aspergillus niger TaxID=5061 RepID=A2Q8G1_ASPNC|nr:uncharacterized protein BO96DRAFT_406126 [Aspergillus niger CBS 101883]XP_059599621.1 hypothetical protein An01g04220 [Aspergillus niger]PYH50360.1 hypothetical protein BO96DRAFT_406126 [Aspergillus niger CBS 101883]RDH14251.1 hypothetical protein M747DRAFT_319663 [Aspergillus niger ATCC 13496]CAK36958.1 hypothetical protein An01g04220 [Aspergillus niger]
MSGSHKPTPTPAKQAAVVQANGTVLTTWNLNGRTRPRLPFTFSNETLPTWLGSIVVLELLGTKLPFPSDKHGSPTRQLTCCLLIYNPIVCLARLTQPQMERDILSLTGHVDGGFRPCELRRFPRIAPSILSLRDAAVEGNHWKINLMWFDACRRSIDIERFAGSSSAIVALSLGCAEIPLQLVYYTPAAAASPCYGQFHRTMSPTIHIPTFVCRYLHFLADLSAQGQIRQNAAANPTS